MNMYIVILQGLLHKEEECRVLERKKADKGVSVCEKSMFPEVGEAATFPEMS